MLNAVCFCYCISQDKLGFAVVTTPNNNKNTQQRKPQSHRLGKVYFSLLLSNYGSWSHCNPHEILWARTGCSILTCASTITRWEERCWQLRHWHLKLSPRNSTPNWLICSYFIGQCKSPGYRKPLGEWGSSDTRYRGEQAYMWGGLTESQVFTCKTVIYPNMNLVMKLCKIGQK